MRFVVYVAGLCFLLGATGCFGGKHKNSPPPPVVDLNPSATNAASNTFIITPDQNIAGRVSRVNEDLHFVVLTFPMGQLPPIGSRMNVFRSGAIVGEIKITEPQHGDNSAADIVLGDAQKGDEVRPK
jgi:hypothetical protein